MRWSVPTVEELHEINADGREAGGDLRRYAGSCPYSPPNQLRHRSWMDGFSVGRRLHSVAGPATVASEQRISV